MTISEFSGEFSWLSNFHLSMIVHDGRWYFSSEHVYQSAKTDDFSWKERIRTASTPGKAKRLGSKCPIRNDWQLIKLDVMRKCIYAKFKQNQCLGDKLVATGDEYIEEGNTWGDKFWGTVDGIGENWLGRIIMDVREKLIEEKEIKEKVNNILCLDLKDIEKMPLNVLTDNMKALSSELLSSETDIEDNETDIEAKAVFLAKMTQELLMIISVNRELW
jgi:hypothetical protein